MGVIQIPIPIQMLGRQAELRHRDSRSKWCRPDQSMLLGWLTANSPGQLQSVSKESTCSSYCTHEEDKVTRVHSIHEGTVDNSFI